MEAISPVWSNSLSISLDKLVEHSLRASVSIPSELNEFLNLLLDLVLTNLSSISCRSSSNSLAKAGLSIP